MCSGLHALSICATVQCCTVKSLHSKCYIKSLILFKHTSMLSWFWCRVYITYFFVFSIKEHEITKNKRKKLFKNVIAKLSGNKVVLLRKNVPVLWPSCTLFPKSAKVRVIYYYGYCQLIGYGSISCLGLLDRPGQQFH